MHAATSSDGQSDRAGEGAVPFAREGVGECRGIVYELWGRKRTELCVSIAISHADGIYSFEDINDTVEYLQRQPILE